METGSLPSTSADHLCVLVHELWGNPQHLDYLATALREKYSGDRLHTLVAKRNSGYFTYDGIELGGERVTREIEETLEELATSGQKITKLSIIGYSLGGLVARYAIGLLYHNGWFEKLEPVNFTTFATPHLGIRSPLLRFYNRIWNVLGARTLSVSGSQLFTIDSFRETGRPLLSILADPNSIFIQALAKFKHRSLYTNIIKDRSAVYYTTSISRIDPYANLNKVKLNYLPGYDRVLLDPDNPVSPKDEEVHPSFTRRLAVDTRTMANKLPTLFFLLFFLPIGTVLFLVNSGVQSVLSRQRIRMYELGKAGIDIGVYRIPLTIDDVRRTAEDMFGNLNSTQRQAYLPAGSEELAATTPRSPPLSPTRPRTASSHSAKPADPTAALDGTAAAAAAAAAARPERRLVERQLEFPTLALTPHQFAMIQALDQVGFRKYPVYIRHDRHSHAALIVRTNKKSFDEGKVVVRHWLDGFEV